MKIAVIGLGYVGLPLAVQAAQKGHHVIGIDLNNDLLNTIRDRRSPYVNDPRFEAAIITVKQEDLEVYDSYEKIQDAEVVIICVPTPTENNIPDLSFVNIAAKQVAENMRNDQLIIIESTVNPGVTRDDVLPILEQVSGMQVGSDFYLAHCPERIDPGNKQYFVGNIRTRITLCNTSL